MGEVDHVQPFTQQPQLCRHARQRRVDVCTALGLPKREATLPFAAYGSGGRTKKASDSAARSTTVINTKSGRHRLTISTSRRPSSFSASS